MNTTAATLTPAQEVAKVIAHQLTHNEHRSTGLLAAMVGGKNFCAGTTEPNGEGDYYFAFKHAAGGPTNGRINFTKIILDGGADLYRIEYAYIRGMKYTVRHTSEGVFGEDLKRLWEDRTGLYLSLR
jgi:hypothetical protein